ncbi:MarR family winged helix-turn-helix transcriptional regulator [Pelotomaculum propionicicum]|uniref:MarR family winged helix-turn-helix transcriptional regulator n=1 Tax=Pelotomaculum propionicicum TaxID=258475 RepID=UPI003B7EE860
MEREFHIIVQGINQPLLDYSSTSNYNISMKKGNALSLISRIREKANKFIVRELENHGIKGIVPSHGDILVVLFKGDKYTMRELADMINRTKPTVTVLVDKLVEYGFVEREKSCTDSRVTYIKLTGKGNELKPVFDDISKKIDALLYGDLTDGEAEDFEMLLHKVNANLD